MKSLGVGLIGTGFMGKCHALAWNAVRPVFAGGPAPRLLHLAEVDAGLAARRADEFGFLRSTGDWRDVVADPEVDVVSVTAPNQFHAEMAIAVLRAGKHLWCEKPMAPSIDDAVRMRDAARQSGKIAVLGYNYIQNPAIRHVSALLARAAIGEVNHVRIEMDEDFMADPEDLFYWKNEATSGYGALDDFGVHPLSLLHVLFGPVERVMCHMARPYAERPLKEGGRRAVETYDIASVLFELSGDISGMLALNRSAWGRKGRLTVQVFGAKGSILFDQERFNELQVYFADDPAGERWFRTILIGPQHPPYDRFIPAPGHGLGFNDLKVIECHELLALIAGEPARVISFEEGVAIEATVHAMARSAAEQRWVEVNQP